MNMVEKLREELEAAEDAVSELELEQKSLIEKFQELVRQGDVSAVAQAHRRINELRSEIFAAHVEVLRRRVELLETERATSAEEFEKLKLVRGEEKRVRFEEMWELRRRHDELNELEARSTDEYREEWQRQIDFPGRIDAARKELEAAIGAEFQLPPERAQAVPAGVVMHLDEPTMVS